MKSIFQELTRSSGFLCSDAPFQMVKPLIFNSSLMICGTWGLLQDEVVKLSPHARAIRDVEDEELRSFFYGMSPWQVDF